MNSHHQMQNGSIDGVKEGKDGHDLAHQFMGWFSGMSAAISLSPFLLRALDVGNIRQVQRTLDHNGACCSIIAAKKPDWASNYSFSSLPEGMVSQGLDGVHNEIYGASYGIAGFISSLLMRVPGIGYHLGTGVLPEPLNDMLRSLPKGGEALVNLKLANALSAGGIILLGEVSGRAIDRKSTRLNSSHVSQSRMPSSA